MLNKSNSSMRYDGLSPEAMFEDNGVEHDETRSNATGLGGFSGSLTGARMHKIMRMFAVVTACAVAVHGSLVGVRHFGIRPARSARKEVVEDFWLPIPAFNLRGTSSNLEELANLTNPSELTRAFNVSSPFNFTPPQLQPLEDMVNGEHFNFTNPFDFTKPSNSTPPQLQPLEDIVSGEHFNFTNPFDFTKPSNFTPPQMQKLKNLSVFLPSFVDVQHEYYDSGKVVMGSWHWPSCDKDHMDKCSAMGVHGCCCKPGFAYVAGNVGGPIAKGTAAGAAVGALVTGALLGSDIGTSTASGAASGALGGAVQYLLEGGACKQKEQLSKSVQSHIS